MTVSVVLCNTLHVSKKRTSMTLLKMLNPHKNKNQTLKYMSNFQQFPSMTHIYLGLPFPKQECHTHKLLLGPFSSSV